MGSYQIEEKAVVTPGCIAYNMHVWVLNDQEAGVLVTNLNRLEFVLNMDVVRPLEPRLGKYPLGILIQLPSAVYATWIRSRTLKVLGVSLETEIFH